MLLVMLVLIGFILLALEFLVFPGVNVVGILGFISIGAAIYIAYSQMGSTAGHLTLFGIGVGGAVGTWYILRSKTWKRIQLDTEIDSTVEDVSLFVREGEMGIALGRLAPMGKIRVGDYVVEAQSQVGYLPENSEVEVVKVYKNKVVVKPKEIN